MCQYPVDADAPAHPWANAPSPTPFSAVGLPVWEPRKNPRVVVPDASAHTLDGTADPKSRWPSRLSWRPHTSRHCPPTVPTLVSGSGSHHQTQTPGERRASAWRPGVAAQSASGRGTDTTAHRLTPGYLSPPPAALDSVGRRSPHTETSQLLAGQWRGPDGSRFARVLSPQPSSTGRWHLKAWRQ